MARAKLGDEDTNGLFAPTKSKAGRDEREYNRRYGKPTTYRLPSELSEAIKRIAQQEHVGISELVEYILDQFVKRYEDGDTILPKAKKGVMYTLDDTQ
jgi:predicted DNA-binding ribbon-helix-helix protein